MNAIEKPKAGQIEKLKQIIATPSVQEQFQNALKDNSSLFVASLIDVYGSDTGLQKCDPKKMVMEALKAATLKLPINKSLGFAYIVPYKGDPQFQIGYKGYIQLAQRTGQYRYINADCVYDGELKSFDKLTGELDISGEVASEKVIGYFAHMELISGFRKTIFWPLEKVEAHAKKYSASFKSETSPWKKNFDEMALKTVLKNLISHYGIMTVEMAAAVNQDISPIDDIENDANSQDFIDGEIDEPKQEEPAKEEKKDKKKEKPKPAEEKKEEPGPKEAEPDF